MKLKLAHLVSVQFGIFVGVVFCLVVSHFENSRPRVASEEREPVMERAPAIERIPQAEDEPPDRADNGADADLAELAVEEPRTPLPNEYSPEAVERSLAEATRLYYEQIAPRGPVTTTVAAMVPAYTEAVAESAADQTSYAAPETVAYVQPAQVIVYPVPAQFVIFAQRARHANRCQPSSHPAALAADPHRRQDGRGTQSSVSTAFVRANLSSSSFRRPPESLGIAPHRNTGVSSCSPAQRSTSRQTP